MAKESKRKCFKCGSTPAKDSVKMFRFPKPGVINLLRCSKWAKFIFPEKDDTDVSFQKKLYKEHRMLCQWHFNDVDFTDDSKTKLMRTAVPNDVPSSVEYSQQNLACSDISNLPKNITKDDVRGKHCVKCGASPADNPDTVLYKFPKPGYVNENQAELWARYAYPDQPWASKDFQMKLFYEEKMICHRHFKDTWFIDHSLKILRRIAFPDVEEETVLQDDDDVRSLGSPSPQPLSDTSINLTPDVPEPSGLDIVIPSTSMTRAVAKNKTGFEANRSVLNIERNSNTKVPWTCRTSHKVPIASHCVAPGTSKTSVKVPIVSNSVVPETSNARAVVIDTSNTSNSKGPRVSKTRLNDPTTLVNNSVVPRTYTKTMTISKTSNYKDPGTYNNTINVPETLNYRVPEISETRLNASEVSNCKKHIKIIRNLKRKIIRLENKAYFAKLTTNDAIRRLVTNLSAESRRGTFNTQGNNKVNIKRERWTEDDKIRAMRLYRKSPSYYTLMRQMFDLPSTTVILDFILKRVSRIRSISN